MALPVMITQAGQVVVQLADNIMVGHVGTAQLAGVSFANAIFVIGIVSLIGFSQGLTPLVGESMGRDDHRAASRYLKNSFLLNTIVFTLVAAILLVTGLLMGKMGQEPEVLHYARDYYFINLASIVAMLPFFTCRFFAEGVGNTKYAMWITVISNLMNVLLDWVQTGLVYEYDDKVWGHDRVFFAEESLFYPYADCEDRAVLFSHLVRDLLGLDVALVYYPNHLATAVRFTDNVAGDAMQVGQTRYVVCDPTYIGAPVGMQMPNLDCSKVQCIVLDR